jgi:hypothetical protein
MKASRTNMKYVPVIVVAVLFFAALALTVLQPSIAMALSTVSLGISINTFWVLARLGK